MHFLGHNFDGTTCGMVLDLLSEVVTKEELEVFCSLTKEQMTEKLLKVEKLLEAEMVAVLEIFP